MFVCLSVCVFVHTQTKEVVRSLKINGDVSGVAFSPNGKVFVNSGESASWSCDITKGKECPACLFMSLDKKNPRSFFTT